MMVLALVIILIVLLLIGFKYLESTVLWVARRQQGHHERISSLETHEVSQDIHIHAVETDVKELGKDVGWEDSHRGTDVFRPEQESIHDRDTPLVDFDPKLP